jgi:ADP-ribose pyrophosphatase
VTDSRDAPEAPDLPDRLAERVVASELVHRGSYLELRIEQVERADGSRARREVVGHPGAVAIVALDTDDRIVLVRQWRGPAERALLEIPAGTLDRDPSGATEDPDRAAARELAEETGLRAGSWRKLAEFWTAPGFATELMHLYLATDLGPADDGHALDEDERLEVEWVSFADAVAAAERGEIADAKTLVGLFRVALDRPRP